MQLNLNIADKNSILAKLFPNNYLSGDRREMSFYFMEGIFQNVVNFVKNFTTIENIFKMFFKRNFRLYRSSKIYSKKKRKKRLVIIIIFKMKLKIIVFLNILKIIILDNHKDKKKMAIIITCQIWVLCCSCAFKSLHLANTFENWLIHWLIILNPQSRP